MQDGKKEHRKKWSDHAEFFRYLLQRQTLPENVCCMSELCNRVDLWHHRVRKSGKTSEENYLKSQNETCTYQKINSHVKIPKGMTTTSETYDFQNLHIFMAP